MASESSWYFWYELHKNYLEPWDRKKFLRYIGIVHAGTATLQQAQWFSNTAKKATALKKRDDRKRLRQLLDGRPVDLFDGNTSG